MTAEALRVVAKKKLIEVALPLDVVNAAAAGEKNNPFLKGHPRALHHWWSPKPLLCARALIFAQMVDDPSANPDLFPSEWAQERERRRLFRIIEDLVQWENTTNEEVLERASAEIWQSWRRACAENAGHPQAKVLFDRNVLPAFYDPFAGGGAIPLEAQRLGLATHASDLNPVAVLINQAKIEIPPKFAGQPPVNPQARCERRLMDRSWQGARGITDDVRQYGRWVRDEAEKRIGHLYPQIQVTAEMARHRPDLERYVGRDLTVIAWIWTRTVKSPNPAFSHLDVPLASTFVLSKKKGKEAYVESIMDDDRFQFKVSVGRPPQAATSGTRVGRANFVCLASGAPIPSGYIRSEAKAGRLASCLMATVAEGDRERVYLSPIPEQAEEANEIQLEWTPDLSMPDSPRYISPPLYGLSTYAEIFTNRQLIALTTLSDLVTQARDLVRSDAVASGVLDDSRPLHEGGSGATAYADAIAIYLSLALSKLADYSNTLCTWNSTNQNVSHMFTGQAIPMSWNFAEASPLHYGLSFQAIADLISRSLHKLPAKCAAGRSYQSDSTITSPFVYKPVIQTDPPYFDNISYADLSDFFYVWLRRLLLPVLPNLFATLAVPKSEELVATPYRHGSKRKAELFFVDGMTQAMSSLSQQSHPGFPITIYYAFKQSEGGRAGVRSTGWETFLDAAIRAGLSIGGTWPMRTERKARALAIRNNALASSIVLACRPRSPNAPSAVRREVQEELRAEFPRALTHLRKSNIAPVDLAQAAIGPGMAVFTRYREVLNANGSPMSVRDALALINSTLDEVLAEQESDFDADSRWALTWFEQHGFTEGEYGVAEQLSKAKNTSVDGLVLAGIVESRRGKVRILKPEELDPDWDPATDSRLTIWEMTQHLIRSLSTSEQTTAQLAAKLGSRAETARDLAYRLYTLSDRRKRAADALRYNGLVQSWPEIVRIAGEQRAMTATQGALAIDGAQGDKT